MLPRVLILTLKRYSLNDYGSFDKKLEPVRIPRHLNLAPVSKREPLMPSPYDNHQDVLGCVLCHIKVQKLSSQNTPLVRPI